MIKFETVASNFRVVREDRVQGTIFVLFCFVLVLYSTNPE